MYEIFVGGEETMQMVADRGAKGLNPKTMRWQIIDKGAKYNVRIDKTIPDDASPTGFTNMATLLCDKDLRGIAKQKGLIL